MELIYSFNHEYSLDTAVFEGLNGREYVTSTKEALNIMKVRNPAVAFSENARKGVYDSLSDEEYGQALDTIRILGTLWRYPEDPEEEKNRYEMNVLSLLANAMIVVSRQEAQLRRYREEK